MEIENENIGDDVIDEEIEDQSEEMLININVPSNANNQNEAGKQSPRAQMPSNLSV